DVRKYPKASIAKGRLEVIQEPGEIIFVPTAWHHQVWNLEDTISINHNWINGTNISTVWTFLVESLNQVEHAIRDCCEMEDWIGQCQILLKATHGMDFHEFYTFLKVIAQRRIDFLTGKYDLKCFNYWKLGKNQALYDLKKLAWCLEQLLDDQRLDTIKVFQNLDNGHPSDLLEAIKIVL
ncbi:unnamed protein product, partial [Meganyctiphanes norvegica]